MMNDAGGRQVGGGQNRTEQNRGVDVEGNVRLASVFMIKRCR